MDRRVHVCGKAKCVKRRSRSESESEMGDLSRWHAARNPVIYPWPGCMSRKRDRRTEAVNVEKFWHDCGEE